MSASAARSLLVHALDELGDETRFAPPLDPLIELAEILERIDERQGRSRRRRATCTEAWLARGHLASAGVGFAGRVPADIVLWMLWADRGIADAPRVRSWRTLPLEVALATRVALRNLRDAPAGPWVPIMTNRRGDLQIYVATSPRGGEVTCWYADESVRFMRGPGTSLVAYAQAVLDNLPPR